MGPITHTMVGVGVGALSGQTVTPYNPIYCATVLGALMPDLDIVTMLKSNLTLIRHHRGATHSFGGIIVLSVIIASILYVDFGGPILAYFFWALAGTVSHIFLDYLNSYGTRLFWPITSRPFAGNLLMFKDPYLTAVFVPVLIFYTSPFWPAVAAFSVGIVYLLLRWIMRSRVERILKEKYGLSPGREKLAVMPALKGSVSWDFLIERPREILVGTLNYFGGKIDNIRSLERKDHTPLTNKALHSAPGRIFRQFTSYYHISYWEEKGRYFVKLMDLRFKNKTDFFYKATLIFNKHHSLEEAYFHRHSEAIPMENNTDRETSAM